MSRFFSCITLFVITFALQVNSQWIKCGLDTCQVYRLATIGSTIFAGTLNCGIYRSDDNGNHWQTASSGLPNGQQIWSLFTNGTDLFAGTDRGGCFTSVDKGESWTAVSDLGVGSFVMSFVQSGANLLAGTRGVYVSADEGKQWSWCGDSLLTGKTIFKLAANGKGGVFAGTGSDGVFYSDNDGISWKTTSLTIKTMRVWSLAAKGDTVFAGTDAAGVIRSMDNGINWFQVNSGLTSKYIHSVEIIRNQLYVGTDSGVFVSASNGEDWKPLVGLETHSVRAIISNADTNIFAGSYQGGVWRLQQGEVNRSKPASNQLPFQLRFKNSNRIPELLLTLPYAAGVVIKVYDMKGCKISQTRYNTLSNGSHCLAMTNKRLSPGCYLVSVQSILGNSFSTISLSR